MRHRIATRSRARRPRSRSPRILNKPGGVTDSTRIPELPLRLQEVINNCLEKERDLRYQTAADLRADLRRLRGDLDAVHGRSGTNHDNVERCRHPLYPANGNTRH